MIKILTIASRSKQRRTGIVRMKRFDPVSITGGESTKYARFPECVYKILIGYRLLQMGGAV